MPLKTHCNIHQIAVKTLALDQKNLGKGVLQVYKRLEKMQDILNRLVGLVFPTGSVCLGGGQVSLHALRPVSEVDSHSKLVWQDGHHQG
eukprot:546010-Amphidinium_carterae.1